MKNLTIPENYKSELNLHDTQVAIKTVKDFFQKSLAERLNLLRVSAPLFVTPASGLNDNLNGVERPVSFGIREQGDAPAEIVHSLAKWKRFALKKYGFSHGEGLYTDMSAIRRDEDTDNIHSIYVDQWDWEQVITKEMRTTATLQSVVIKIIDSLVFTQDLLCQMFPVLPAFLTRKVHFITTQELEDAYPHLSPNDRETEITRLHGAVFLSQIGGKLASGKPHDTRAPDYDDWALNGDILVWNPVLECAFELSSMGIRVDAASLGRQLTLSGCDNRRELPFHNMLLNNLLPLTMGGGIGQSRICMLLLGKAHIGEVQASVWPQAMRDTCEQNGIILL